VREEQQITGDQHQRDQENDQERDHGRSRIQ
jgi:hypothetical protein